jgi:hypothetical protein
MSSGSLLIAGISRALKVVTRAQWCPMGGGRGAAEVNAD